MSSFRTTLLPEKSLHPIHHRDAILCLGSCFAQHIGQQLQEAKFSTLINPFGILYNPIAIYQGLEWMMSDRLFSRQHLFQHHGLWHSFAHHGHFSHADPELCLQEINDQLNAGRAQLQQGKYLILTLGTAHVFRHIANDTIVANCHKLPNKHFERSRLSISEITKPLADLCTQLNLQFPDLQIIASVSPVRHLRDGHLENQRSKSTLLLALSTITEQFPFVHYFPAYELLLDDLRDYRFYQEDMIHPSMTAINYIWDFFIATFLEEETQQLMAKIKKIKQASEHRPFRPDSPTHQQFLQEQLQKISQLEKAFSFLDFTAEKQLFEKNVE